MGVLKSTDISYHSYQHDKVYQKNQEVQLTFKVFNGIKLLKYFINVNGTKRKYVINLMDLKNS